MNTNLKSSTAAGLLGIFLGAFGAHDWYLGNTKRGTIHVCLAAGGLLLTIITVALYSLSGGIPVLNIIFGFLTVIAYIVLVGNGIWGFVEGIIILAQGDAGLYTKGYKVANSQVYAQATGIEQPQSTDQAATDAPATAQPHPEPKADESPATPTTATTPAVEPASSTPAPETAPTTPAPTTPASVTKDQIASDPVVSTSIPQPTSDPTPAAPAQPTSTPDTTPVDTTSTATTPTTPRPTTPDIPTTPPPTPSN